MNIFNSGVNEKMIKTDKAVYRTRTLEEYDWLMKRLEEAVCKWYTGRKPTGLDIFYTYKSDTCIFVEDKKLTYTNSDSCKNELDYEIIEVSDLMENEIKTDKVIYHTKTQEEYDWLMEKLEEAGLMWAGGSSPTAPKQADNWRRYSTETCVNCEDERIVFADFDFYKNESDYKDYEFIEVSDLMKKPLKTDKVIYHTNTQEEFDWLMEQLQEAGCEWQGGGSPICGKEVCDSTKTDSYICVENGTISFLDEDYVYDYMYNQDYELIEVSDLMENEKKTEILDKLETMNEYLNNKLKKLEKEDDESQKIKKIVYTTEVYFE